MTYKTDPIVIDGLMGGDGDVDGCSVSIVAITDPSTMYPEARILVGSPKSSTMEVVSGFSCTADTAIEISEAFLKAADAVATACPEHAPEAVELARLRKVLAERTFHNAPQKCGWCVKAAGDTQEAADAAPVMTLVEVREHALSCEHNPLVVALGVGASRAHKLEAVRRIMLDIDIESDSGDRLRAMKKIADIVGVACEWMEGV